MPHLGTFLRAQIQGKGAVGRIKDMMPLVKDIAGGASPITLTITLTIAGWCISRIDHDKRMVADDDIGTFRPAHRFFHKAPIVMRAGAVDAFPPTVGKPDGLWAAHQVGQPGGKGRAG